MRRRLGSTLISLLAACGDSGSDSSALPADAEEMRTYLRSGVTLVMPRLGGAGSVLIFALNPGSPGATGIQFDPDPAPGAPPHSYIFTVPLDGDGNGSNETTFTGEATFSDDPALPGDGFSGHVTLTMQTAGGLGTLEGNLDFSLGPVGGEVSGTGTFTELITGNATTLTVAPAHPLQIQMARGTTNSVANACGSSLNGDLQFDVTGPTGTMTSTWGFANTRKTVAVTGAAFTDNNTKTTPIPDADVTIPCGQNGGINDWTGAFTQNWVCAPAEFGSATLTLSVAAGDKISIIDEDPPGSGDIATYDATIVSGNPHVVRGFFIGGEVGNTYREDFSWILAEDGHSFSDISKYVYQEGPNLGSGGICGGQASPAP
jgi:hypothetical protein